jgi:hypothetical protein
VGIASSVIIIASYNGCEKFTNLFWNASNAAKLARSPSLAIGYGEPTSA